MDHSVTFARHFARLIWLIRSQPDSVDDQKGSLRAIMVIVKDGAIELRAEAGRLLADGTPLPDVLTGVREVAAALSGAPVPYALRVDRGAAPADILGVARLIAADSPDAFVDRVAHLAPATLRMEPLAEDAPTARARPTAQLTKELIAEIEAEKRPLPPPEPAPGAKRHEDQPAPDATRHEVQPSPDAAETPVPRVSGDDAIDSAFARLATMDDPKTAAHTLEELAGRIDVHAREGRPTLVVQAIDALIDRDLALPEGDLRRAYLVASRRVYRPQVLRMIMSARTRDDETRRKLQRILERAGDDGAMAVFDEIERAPTLADRATLVEMLGALPSAASVLVRLLGDARWYVARAAADLLGELGAAESERAIADMLRHYDDRVRRSATAALARFDTAFTVDALYRALSDRSAQVRLQAVHALASRRTNPQAASHVVNAIDDEPEIEVQLAEIAALGRFATGEAVSKLARAAGPEGRLFRRKDSAYRIAAVQALGEARTPAAMATLQSLLGDREKDVRDAVARIMGRR